jgi:thiol-disulfide isomerase/thioredoxin
MSAHFDLYSLNVKKIKIIIISCVLLTYGTTVFAKGPNLTGSMKKFQLTPITKNSMDETGYFDWKNAKGETLSLNDFKGRVILLNFWATWCLPCIKELPSMERLQTKFKEDNFTIIAISLDRGGKSVAARLLKRLKLNKLTLYIDKENKSAQKLGVKFMPTTFIFDREGRKLGKLQGGIEWDSKNAEALIKYFINNPTYASTKKNK